MMSEAITLPKELRNFVDTAEWTFAKTMPEWPHEYIVRDRIDEKLFVQLVRHIREHGFEGRFYQRVLTYFAEDDFYRTSYIARLLGAFVAII